MWEGEIMNWFDLVIVVVIIGFALWGKNVGFVRALFKMGTSLIAILISVFLYPVVASLLSNTPVHSAIRGAVTNWVNSQVNIQSLSAAGSSNIEQVVNNSPIPSIMRYTVINSTSAAIGSTATNVNQIISSMCESITLVIINVVALILTIIVVRVGLIFLSKFLHGIVSRIPIIRGLNSLLGFAIGAIEGFLIIYIISTILIFFNTGYLSIFSDALRTCFFSQIFYYNNIIANSIMKL
jgi:uncharacterized membrane protein required for colicin V production